MSPPELVSAALEQAPIVANLLELYAHDFSEFHEVPLGEDGRFGYRALSLYWSEPSRHPFLIRIDGRWAGLAMVKRGSEISGDQSVWDMAEFFIVRGSRRRGFGVTAAHAVWRQFPGPWEVRVMESNVSAYPFWSKAVAQFTGEIAAPVAVEKGGKRWRVFSFVSKG